MQGLDTRGATMSKIVPVSEAVGRIPDAAILSVSSSSTLGCPDAVLKAIGDRFALIPGGRKEPWLSATPVLS